MRRRLPRVVEHHHLGGHERAVVAIRDGANTESRDDEIKCVHGAHYILRLCPSFGRLLGYARRYQREFLTGLACSIATSTVALISPMVLRYAVDDLGAAGHARQARSVCGPAAGDRPRRRRLPFSHAPDPDWRVARHRVRHAERLLRAPGDAACLGTSRPTAPAI